MNRLFFISSLGLIRASFQFLNLNSKKKGILMIVRFNPCSEDLQRLQVGPIGPHLPTPLLASHWRSTLNPQLH
jgi:hypothetical protein